MISKKSIVLLLIVILFFIFRYDIKSSLLDFSNNYKMSFSGIIDFTLDAKNKYFNQIKTIEFLKKENSRLSINSMKYLYLQEEILKYNKFYSRIDPLLAPIKILSFIKLGDPNQFWITKPQDMKLDSEKNYGIIDHDITYGIAKLENKNLKLMTNLDKGCVYSVYVGDNNISGIIFGNTNNMIVKFIPTWKNPKVGSKVYTSGLDNIFYRGIEVGVVSKVIKNEKYISLEVDVRSRDNIKDFLHLILLDY